MPGIVVAGHFHGQLVQRRSGHGVQSAGRAEFYRFDDRGDGSLAAGGRDFLKRQFAVVPVPDVQSVYGPALESGITNVRDRTHRKVDPTDFEDSLQGRSAADRNRLEPLVDGVMQQCLGHHLGPNAGRVAEGQSDDRRLGLVRHGSRSASGFERYRTRAPSAGTSG